jgi:hypothetical protein
VRETGTVFVSGHLGAMIMAEGELSPSLLAADAADYHRDVIR